MNESISQRIKQMVDHFAEGKNTVFANKIGTNEANIRNYINGSQPKFEVISSIARSFDVSYSWLLLGEGEMIEPNEPITKIDTDSLSVTKEHEIVYKKSSKSREMVGDAEIPLYDLQASAGLIELFQDYSSQTAIDVMKIPNSPPCDGAVFVTGDSMYPLLKSGDIVGFTSIKDFATEIFWGEMYIISVTVGSEEFVSVKFIQKSEKGEEWIKLVSQNKNHQDKDVHLSKVRAMALVKISVRINSMR